MNPRELHSPRFSAVERLPGGRSVCLRWMSPADREQLIAAFDRLSARSRRLRCFGPKSTLSERELAFFTTFEPGRHAALCALAWDPEAGTEGEGVGGLRYVRVDDAPGLAELAVTVIDDWHGRGVATRLIDHMLPLLPALGFTGVRVSWYDDNLALERLMTRALGSGRRTREHNVITAEFDLVTMDRAA